MKTGRQSLSWSLSRRAKADETETKTETKQEPEPGRWSRGDRDVRAGATD